MFVAGVLATSTQVSKVNIVPEFFVEVAHAQVIEPISTSTIEQMVGRYAAKYHLNTDRFKKTVFCESQYNPNIQSQWFDQYGKQEESYGLAQIHLPDHPEVTKAQAEDPDFALEFMASAWASSTPTQIGNLWHCYRNLYLH